MALDPVTAALDLGGLLIEKIWPDPAKQAAEARKLAELAQSGKLTELHAHVELLKAQAEVNAKEAQHKSIFVAGWRPFVGWVCGFSLLYAAMLYPFMQFIAVLTGFSGQFPSLDTDTTMQILLGMLGLGVYRTYEKTKGVAREK